MINHKTNIRQGFTIVELLIVIVVIAILATIAILSYNGIRNQAEISTIKNEADSITKQLEIERVQTDVYPTNLTSVKKSGNFTYQYSINTSPASFCVTLTSSAVGDYFFSNTAPVPDEGVCSGHTASTGGSGSVIVNGTALAAGGVNTCILQSGNALCIGLNNYGQLGNGTYNNSTSFTPVSNISNVASVDAGGGDFSCAISNNKVYCWGSNTYGQLGDGSYVESTVPVLVSGLNNVSQISLGYDSACALSGGSVYCWGDNWGGQLANSTITDSSSPILISGLSNVTDVSMGDGAACAVSAGQLYCWGDNWYGQLGNGQTQTTEYSPVAVPGMTSVSKVVASSDDNTCAINNGQFYCWGDNWGGLLGTGSDLNTPAASPQLVTGISNVSDMQIGSGYACATSGGQLYCWGQNSRGQLGDGTRTNNYSPTVVSGVSNVSSFVAASHTCAVSVDGLYCWGDDWYYGQLGNPHNYGVAGSSTPIMLPNSLYTGAYASVAGSTGAFNCATSISSSLYCWGNSSSDSFVVLSNSPALISGFPSTVGEISTGMSYACALSNASAYCWGVNQQGQLGDGTTNNSFVPLQVNIPGGAITHVSVSRGDVVNIHHSCATRSVGGVYCWGINAYGQLGNGSSGSYAPVLTPTAVLGISGVVSEITSGTEHTCALASGVAYCWGSNFRSELGSSPGQNVVTSATAVVGLTGSPSKIAAGEANTCAIVSGSLYCWGDNQYGQMGTGTADTVEYTAPTLINGLPGTVTDVSLGSGSTVCAIASGDVYCWGRNYSTQYSIFGESAPLGVVGPTKILGLSNGVTHVATGSYAVCAISGGDVYCWGDNTYHSLGDNGSEYTSIPVIVNI